MRQNAALLVEPTTLLHEYPTGRDLDEPE